MRSSTRGAVADLDVLYGRLVVHTSGLRAEAVKPSKQKPPQALQRQYPVLRQVWLSAIPMDSTPVVDATPSVLRSVEHCKSLVIAGDSAALTYAEANLPSFFPGNCKLALDHDFYPSQRKSKNLQCCHTLQQLDQVSQVQHEINRHVRAYGKAADPACFKQVMRPMVDYLYNSMPNLQQVFNMQRSAGQERLLACRLIDSTGCARVHIQGQWDLQ
ncbi:hypothetical protein WJX82_004650 [Trebouxia sp. C0006]